MAVGYAALAWPTAYVAVLAGPVLAAFWPTLVAMPVAWTTGVPYRGPTRHMGLAAGVALFAVFLAAPFVWDFDDADGSGSLGALFLLGALVYFAIIVAIIKQRPAIEAAPFLVGCAAVLVAVPLLASDPSVLSGLGFFGYGALATASTRLLGHGW